MDFSLCLRIKAMVREFNKYRSDKCFAAIAIHCNMDSVGHWSVNLSLECQGCFLCDEMRAFEELCYDNHLIFFVGCDNVSPVLYFQ